MDTNLSDKEQAVKAALGLTTDESLVSPAGADLLLRTLLARGHQVQFVPFAGGNEIVACIMLLEHAQWLPTKKGRGADQREALLDAAYRLLKADDRKTMDDVSANANAGSVICDGCNVRKGWEHRCHSGLQFGESFARIMIRGEAHEDTICECSECKAVGRSIPTRHRPQR